MAFRSSSSLAGTSVANSAVPVPAGAAIGDIAVVALYIESTATITPPAGFTNKADLATLPTARGRLAVYWKRLTAADSGTYTFTHTAAFHAAAAGLWSGRVATGDPFDGTVGTAESTVGVTTLNVSTSPVAANGDAVGFWTNFNGGGSFTAPASYTERVDLPEVTLDTRDAVASGTTGNVTATCSITDFMKAFLGVLAQASAGGTTGTIAATQDGNTAAASGQLRYSGTAAPSQANQTAAATGQLGYTGTTAVTQAANTATATGQLGYSGTATPAQAANTASASGTFTPAGTVSGSIAVTQANQTAAASGQLRYSGTAAASQANQTATATGKLGYTGTVARTQANQTAIAAGAVVSSITGTAAPSQANQTASIAGYFAPLVTFGSASAGVGFAPSSHPNVETAPRGVAAAGVAPSSHSNIGLAPRSTSATGAVPSATGVRVAPPTSTGA